MSFNSADPRLLSRDPEDVDVDAPGPRMMARGRFITFEGVEGAGKSSQIPPLADWLRGRGIAVVTTREPGGSPIAERIRAVLLDRDNTGMSETAELLLVFAARAEHLDKVIEPALAAGTWVLCDRFTDATYAYQGGGRGLPVAQIDALAGIVHPQLWPDLTVLLDLPVDAGIARATHRNGATGPDRLETEQREFFERVRVTYLARARDEPGRFRVIDAGGTLDEVSAAIRAAIEPLLEETR